MKELLRAVDPALISYVESLLKGANIHYFIADQHTSMVEGSIGILPKRILVIDEELATAQQILTDADLDHELKHKPGTATS